MKNNLCSIIRDIFERELERDEELMLCDIFAPHAQHMQCKSIMCLNCPVGTGSHYMKTRYMYDSSYLRIL